MAARTIASVILSLAIVFCPRVLSNVSSTELTCWDNTGGGARLSVKPRWVHRAGWPPRPDFPFWFGGFGQFQDPAGPVRSPNLETLAEFTEAHSAAARRCTVDTFRGTRIANTFSPSNKPPWAQTTAETMDPRMGSIQGTGVFGSTSPGDSSTGYQMIRPQQEEFQQGEPQTAPDCIAT